MPVATTFTGGGAGDWRIVRNEVVRGEPLGGAARLAVEDAATEAAGGTAWALRGVPSYERYVRCEEQEKLQARSPELGRPEATHAALIPIHKTAAWWDLAQDERRWIFEERSHHIQTGLEYLPAVARGLYHSRELGEPFDFLTWFEYAPADSSAFEELVERLRQTEEWAHVDREIDIRLVRE